MARGAAGASFPAAVARVGRGMVEIAARRWLVLLGAGLLIFIPIGLLETIDLSIQEAIFERGGDRFIDYVEMFGVGSVHAVGAVFGEVLFAGVVTSIVLVERTSRGFSFRALISDLDLKRLALADVLLVLATIAGLVAFLIPGLIFVVWFALVGPVIEVEHKGVRAAFGRSRELVRRRFWLVAAFVLPLSVLDETLTELAHSAAESIFGETFFGEWGAGTLSELVTALPYALAAVMLYLELAGPPSAPSGRRSSPGTDPRESLRSRRAAST